MRLETDVCFENPERRLTARPSRVAGCCSCRTIPALGAERAKLVERAALVDRCTWWCARTDGRQSNACERIDHRSLPLRRTNAITTSIRSADASREHLVPTRGSPEHCQQRRVEQRDERLGNTSIAIGCRPSMRAHLTAAKASWDSSAAEAEPAMTSIAARERDPRPTHVLSGQTESRAR